MERFQWFYKYEKEKVILMTDREEQDESVNAHNFILQKVRHSSRCWTNNVMLGKVHKLSNE